MYPCSRSIDTVQFCASCDLHVFVFTVYFPHQTVLRAEGELIQTHPSLLLHVIQVLSTDTHAVFHPTFRVCLWGSTYSQIKLYYNFAPANETVYMR